MNIYEAKGNFQTWTSSKNQNELTEEEAYNPQEMTYNMIVSMYDDNTPSSSPKGPMTVQLCHHILRKGDYLNTLKTPRYMA